MGIWQDFMGWLAPEAKTAQPTDATEPAPRPTIGDLFGLRELHAYGGLIVMGIGAWAIYPPSALVLVGGVLLYLGVWRTG